MEGTPRVITIEGSQTYGPPSKMGSLPVIKKDGTWGLHVRKMGVITIERPTLRCPVFGGPLNQERPAPAGGNALVTFDAQLAKQQAASAQAPCESTSFQLPPSTLHVYYMDMCACIYIELDMHM